MDKEQSQALSSIWLPVTMAQYLAVICRVDGYGFSREGQREGWSAPVVPHEGLAVTALNKRSIGFKQDSPEREGESEAVLAGGELIARQPFGNKGEAALIAAQEAWAGRSGAFEC